LARSSSSRGGSRIEHTRTLGAILYERFELLDYYGPLEMFGSIGPELRIVTVAEKVGPVGSAQGPKTVAGSLSATAQPRPHPATRRL
jgi:hypothetical protein